VTTSFLYDGDAVLLERQGAATTATYTYGNALVRKDAETPLFDGLGSERTVTNTSGAVQGTLTMTAFGQAVASTGSSTDPYEFAATSGYRNDGDAGLMLVGARYYDAQTGIFISRDTVLNQLPYGYCNGNPVNGVDPTGHREWFEYFLDWGAYAGVTAAVIAPIPGADVASIPLGVVSFVAVTFGMMGKYMGYPWKIPPPPPCYVPPPPQLPTGSNQNPKLPMGLYPL
jgi:RHS repeat-associated protein